MTPRQQELFDVANSFFQQVPPEHRAWVDQMYEAFKARMMYECSTVTIIGPNMHRGTIVTRTIDPADQIKGF
jgi:hypothetical protein